jgi:hypothetical protein
VSPQLEKIIINELSLLEGSLSPVVSQNEKNGPFMGSEGFSKDHWKIGN